MTYDRDAAEEILTALAMSGRIDRAEQLDRLIRRLERNEPGIAEDAVEALRDLCGAGGMAEWRIEGYEIDDWFWLVVRLRESLAGVE